MKRTVKKIVLLLAVLLLVGCKPKEVRDVAILTSAEDKAVILFCDENDRVIKEMPIDYPSDVISCSEGIYYTTGDYRYHLISISDFREKAVLENVYGDLIYGDPEGYSYYYADGNVCSSLNGENSVIEDGEDLNSVSVIGSWLCLIRNSGLLHIYDIRNNQFVSSGYLPQSDIYETCIINDRVFVAGDYGYGEITDGNLSVIYVFDRTFDSIDGIKDDIIVLNENSERKIYKISFEPHRMVLTPYDDPSVGVLIDFEKIFSKYYEKGFEVEYFFEY